MPWIFKMVCGIFSQDFPKNRSCNFIVCFVLFYIKCDCEFFDFFAFKLFNLIFAQVYFDKIAMNCNLQKLRKIILSKKRTPEFLKRGHPG
jgi:hypothetical protein